MKQSTFLLLTILLLSLGLELAAADLVPLKIHHVERNANVSENEFVLKACHGTGSYEEDCVDTLESAPEHQKNSSDGLAFFALRFVEDNAANLSSIMKKLLENPDLPPLVQSGLSDCMDQYNPIDDLIEDAINAVLAKAYPDAVKFIEAAITDIDVCDSQLKTQGNGQGDDDDIAKDVNSYNLFFKNLLSATLNLIKPN